jgi:hypothetical protein
MIRKERLKSLNACEPRNGDYVLYWMQAAQRAEGNQALEYAIRQANEKRRPCLVFFGLTDRFPEVNARHFIFMLEGLRETQKALADRGMKLVVRPISPEIGVVEMARLPSSGQKALQPWLNSQTEPEMTPQEEERLLRSFGEAMCDIDAGKGTSIDEVRQRVGSWAGR